MKLKWKPYYNKKSMMVAESSSGRFLISHHGPKDWWLGKWSVIDKPSDDKAYVQVACFAKKSQAKNAAQYISDNWPLDRSIWDVEFPDASYSLSRT